MERPNNKITVLNTLIAIKLLKKSNFSNQEYRAAKLNPIINLEIKNMFYFYSDFKMPMENF